MDWRVGVVAALAVVAAIGVYGWYAASGGEELTDVPYGEVTPAAGPDPSLTVPNPSTQGMTGGQISESMDTSAATPMPLSLGAVEGLTGVWAANSDMCAGGAWHFEDTKVVTDGEMSCQLNTLSRREGGMVTAGFQCTGEGVTGPETWQIDTSAIRQGMISVNRYGRDEVKLVRCGAVGS